MKHTKSAIDRARRHYGKILFMKGQLSSALALIKGKRKHNRKNGPKPKRHKACCRSCAKGKACSGK